MADPRARLSPSAVQAAIWMLFGLLVLALVASGRILTYIKGFWIPFMAVAAAAVIALAASVLWQEWRGQAWRAGTSSSAHTHAGEPSVRRVAWMLLLPVLLVTLAAPDPLGAALLTTASSANTSATQRVKVSTAGTINTVTLERDTVNKVTLEELSDRFTFGDVSTLDGVEVEFIGFVSHGDPRLGGAGVWVNRYKIYCCAADAISYSVKLEDGPLTELSDDQWVRVRGRTQVKPGDNKLLIIPSEVTPIDPPSNPYL